MNISSTPINIARLRYDLRVKPCERFDEYWSARNRVPPELFTNNPNVWLEIGAGSGSFCVELARMHPDRFIIAMERARDRASRLVRKASKSGLKNLAAFRGNAIPTLIAGIPTGSVERIFIMYPCPWQRSSQRKNRWYLHPVMSHLVRALKPGGCLVWTSDQKFYIDEAHFVCREGYDLKPVAYGEISPNPYNALEHFPGGRTKFERTFLAQNLPCYELVVQKS